MSFSGTQTTNSEDLPIRLVHKRMGIFIQNPPSQPPRLPNIEWSHSVVGLFFDFAPPNTSFITNIVNNHWVTRGSIRVLRTGDYFIFECQDPRDRDAILDRHTSIIDGKLITFRSSFANQVPSSINFSLATIWVRIHNLPWRFLDHEWTVRILSHVGLVEFVEDTGPGLPTEAFLRAKLVVDSTRPLIPGCFLPLDDGQVVWVYFRYEGVFKFCKQCGCVGHHTGRCPMSAYDAHHLIHRRFLEFEHDGLTLMFGPMETPLYTNLIRGLPDRFVYRNAHVNLTSFVPAHDPYIFG